MNKHLKKKASKEMALESLKDMSEELSKMKLDTSEKDALHLQIEKLSHQEKIVNNVNKAFELLDELYQKGDIYEASEALKAVKSFDDLYLNGSQKLAEIYYELEGLRTDLKKSLALFDYFSESELDSLQERLQALVMLEKNTVKPYLN